MMVFSKRFTLVMLYRDQQKRRGCLLSYSRAEPGRELTQPRPRLLAEPCTSSQIQSLMPHGISHVTTRQAVSLLSLVSPGQSQKEDIPTLNDYIGVKSVALVPTEVIEMRTRTLSPQPSVRQMLRRKSFQPIPSFLPAIILPSFNPPRRQSGGAGRGGEVAHMMDSGQETVQSWGLR